MSTDRTRPSRTDAAQRGGVAHHALVVVAIATLALLVWQLANVVLLVFGSIVLATALHALVTPLEQRVGLSHRQAFVAATALVVAVLVLLGWLVGDRIAAQLGDLRAQLPQALGALVGWLQADPIGRAILEAWNSARTGDLPWQRIADFATLTIGAFGYALLVVVTGLFLAAEPDLYRRGMLRLVPVAHRRTVDEALVASGSALKRWLLGQAVSMLFVGVATATGLALLGVPLALSLGLIAALLDFVPYFGPLVSGLLIVLFAFTQGPVQALWVAGLCVLIQQLEGNVLMPFAQRWAVSLPPVLTIVAGVAFGLLFGIVGLVFATPLIVVIMVLVRKLYVEHYLEGERVARGGGPSLRGTGER